MRTANATSSKGQIRTEYVKVQRVSDGAILHTATMRSDWTEWTIKEFKKDFPHTLLLTKNGALPIADYYDFEQLTLPEPGSIQAATDAAANQQAPDPLDIIKQQAAAIEAPRGQEGFDPDDYDNAALAQLARFVFAKALQARGYNVKRWTLRNQQRGYSGLGTDRDYSTRNVYILEYWK